MLCVVGGMIVENKAMGGLVATCGIFLHLATENRIRSIMKVFPRLVLLATVLTLPMLGGLFAQGGPTMGGPPPCWPPPCIPIDGGLGLLIGAGALIGGRKLLQLRKPTV